MSNSHTEQQAFQPCRRKIIQWGHDDCVFLSFSYFFLFFCLLVSLFSPIHAKYRIYGWLYYFLFSCLCLTRFPVEKKGERKKNSAKVAGGTIHIRVPVHGPDGSETETGWFVLGNRHIWNAIYLVETFAKTLIEFPEFSFTFVFAVCRPSLGQLPLPFVSMCVDFCSASSRSPMAFLSVSHPWSTAPPRPFLHNSAFIRRDLLFLFTRLGIIWNSIGKVKKKKKE